jgi:hypothetical protein
VRQVVAETGIVRVRRKRAVDSTILADAVATPDTITQLIAAIRRVGRSYPVPPRRSRWCAPGMITAVRGSR